MPLGHSRTYPRALLCAVFFHIRFKSPSLQGPLEADGCEMGRLPAGSRQIKKGTQGITFHFFGGVSLQGHLTLTDSVFLPGHDLRDCSKSELLALSPRPVWGLGVQQGAPLLFMKLVHDLIKNLAPERLMKWLAVRWGPGGQQGAQNHPCPWCLVEEEPGGPGAAPQPCRHRPRPQTPRCCHVPRIPLLGSFKSHNVIIKPSPLEADSVAQPWILLAFCRK